MKNKWWECGMLGNRLMVVEHNAPPVQDGLELIQTYPGDYPDPCYAGRTFVTGSDLTAATKLAQRWLLLRMSTQV